MSSLENDGRLELADSRRSTPNHSRLVIFNVNLDEIQSVQVVGPV